MAETVETKPPVEWILDSLESQPLMIRANDPAAAELLMRAVSNLPKYFCLLLMCAVRHPVATKRRPRLWDAAKDLIAGIESGQLPKPGYWEQIHKELPDG